MWFEQLLGFEQFNIEQLLWFEQLLRFEQLNTEQLLRVEQLNIEQFIEQKIRLSILLNK